MTSSLPVLTGLAFQRSQVSPRQSSPPCGQSLCPLTHLSMQGHYMSFPRKEPPVKCHGYEASWTLFFNNQSPQTVLWTPRSYSCKRVTDVSEKGRRGGVWALISSNPASLLPLNSASSHASDPSGVPGSGAALSTTLSSYSFPIRNTCCV